MRKALLYLGCLLAYHTGQAQETENSQLPTTRTRTRTIVSALTGANAEPVLFSDVNLSYYEVVSTNIQVSKTDNLQKVVVLPLKLLHYNAPDSTKKIRYRFLDNTKVNLAQKDGLSTLGIGLGVDTSYPFSRRGERLFRKLPEIDLPGLMPDPPSKADFKDDAAFLAAKSVYLNELKRYKLAQAAFEKKQRDRYIDYFQQLLRRSFRVTVGANVTLFEVIGGDQVDLNHDNLIDNYYKRSGIDVAASGNYTVNERLTFSLGCHYQRNRAKPIQDTPAVSYVGGSIGVAYRAVTFMKEEDYRKTPEYYKSLFVPGIVFGATAEQLVATANKEAAKDGITRALVVTPFADFRISPQSQFRLGIPLKYYRGISNDTSFGPFLQYTLLLNKQD